MLAQNFKTADDLDITDHEFGALTKVLGMLERGEIPYAADPDQSRSPLVFCMGSPGFKTKHCGTAACIGGHVATIIGEGQFDYVSQYQDEGSLSPLYYPRDKSGHLLSLDTITDAHAAIAVRNYLTHGEPRWAEALAG